MSVKTALLVELRCLKFWQPLFRCQETRPRVYETGLKDTGILQGCLVKMWILGFSMWRIGLYKHLLEWAQSTLELAYSQMFINKTELWQSTTPENSKLGGITLAQKILFLLLFLILFIYLLCFLTEASPPSFPPVPFSNPTSLSPLSQPTPPLYSEDMKGEEGQKV